MRGGHDFYLGPDGGHIIPVHSEIGRQMRRYVDYLVRWHGSGDLLPVYLEDIVYNFYMQKEVATIGRAKPAAKVREQTPVERSSKSGNGSGRAKGL